MRRTASLFFLLLGLVLADSAFGAVEVVVETRTFQVPGRGPRVEVNMAFMAASMTVRTNDRGGHQLRAEAITIIEQAGAIKSFSKVEVVGAERMDTLQMDLLHQEFFDLSPGSYDLYIEVRDLNSTDTTATRYSGPLDIGALSDGVSISDILLAERFDPATEGQVSKYGYIAVPLLSDYYPSNIKTLHFYAEVYGTDKVFGSDSLYLLTYQLESYEKRMVQGAFKRSVRAKGRLVEPIVAQFDIASLPSGNYLLAIEVRDRRGELVTRKEQFIQRNNPIEYNYDLQTMERLDIGSTFVDAYTDTDTLVEFVRCLRPIADPLERKIIDDRWKDRDMELMKRFFFTFWANRAVDPESAWKAYHEQVVKVNKLFSCRVLRGYETDRGRIYLKYGAPNSMMDRFNEMDAYPYTIWHYYRADKYTNRRFVFYQPDLANNCFELLHSEVPGELQNPRWNQILHSRNVAMPNVDPQNVNNSSGERAIEFFDMPR